MPPSPRALEQLICSRSRESISIIEMKPVPWTSAEPDVAGELGSSQGRGAKDEVYTTLLDTWPPYMDSPFADAAKVKVTSLCSRQQGLSKSSSSPVKASPRELSVAARSRPHTAGPGGCRAPVEPDGEAPRSVEPFVCRRRCDPLLEAVKACRTASEVAKCALGPQSRGW